METEDVPERNGEQWSAVWAAIGQVHWLMVASKLNWQALVVN